MAVKLLSELLRNAPQRYFEGSKSASFGESIYADLSPHALNLPFVGPRHDRGPPCRSGRSTSCFFDDLLRRYRTTT